MWQGMIDYEDLILQRQELQEIYEDDPDVWDMMGCSDANWWDDMDPEVFDVYILK